jgi:hypothetical protein
VVVEAKAVQQFKQVEQLHLDRVAMAALEVLKLVVFMVAVVVAVEQEVLALPL